LERALAIRPDLVETQVSLGLVRLDQGRLEDAAAAFERALSLRPEHAPARMNFGNVQHRLGRLDVAIAAYRAVVAQHPDFPDAHANLGAALKDQGDLPGAAASLDRALALKPDHAAAHYGLGGVLARQGRVAEAIAHLERAIALRPGVPEAHASLGGLWLGQGRLEAAEAVYRRVIALRPNESEAHMNLAKALQSQGRLPEAMAEFEQVLALSPDHAEGGDAWLCGLSYEPLVTGRALLAEHRRRAARLGPHPAVAHTNDRDPERRLRVGYVSGDFRRHPVGWFLAPVLGAHDPAKVEVFCYSNDARADEMTARLRQASDHWRDIHDLDDEFATARIVEDRIDLLVDLSGHTPGNRLGLFARRPAPVQAAWLGYATTTGLEAIDYMVMDPWTAPPGAEAWCSEALARLPHARFCYGPPADAPEPGPPPSIAQGQVTFGSFNNLVKIGPEVINLWGCVLAAVPGARLVLKWTALDEPAVRRRVGEMFAAAGVAEDALELRGVSPHHQTLAEYADIDIALDPFPFGGGLTSCEALWMGVPVVTWPGDRFASRQTLSFLTSVGLADLAAQSAEAYVAIAAALAADQDRRVELRRSLRARMTASAIGDGARFTPALEAAYRRMWRRWCAGAAPQAFDLTSAAE
jgi:predicted O-linked N-acetylglucosamine transferase (SPINDLY family)